MAEGVYLYAVCTEPAPTTGVSGLGGRPVRGLADDGLLAAVSTVDLDEFGEQGLRAHLEELTWLEQVARTHDEVVRALARRTPVAPVPLATVFLDDTAVRQRLRDHRAALREALHRVAGRHEWSVKAYAAPQAADGAAAAAGSGTAYLAARRRQQHTREAGARAAGASAERLHRRLLSAAVAGRCLPPQDPRLSGRREPMVLNAAYLVEDAGAGRLRQLVAELASSAPQMHVELDGPWPPYSFATLDPA